MDYLWIWIVHGVCNSSHELQNIFQANTEDFNSVSPLWPNELNNLAVLLFFEWISLIKIESKICTLNAVIIEIFYHLAFLTFCIINCSGIFQRYPLLYSTLHNID